MDEIKIPSARKVGMLIDTTMCMSMFLFAKICSKKEIDIFFEGNKHRLKDQEFTTEEINKHTKNIKGVVFSLKNTLKGGIDD